MKLIDLLGIMDEYERVDLYEKGKTGLIAQYNDKYGIPKAFNDCEVIYFQKFNEVVAVTISPKVPSLAERLDKVMYQFDPYSYDSEECSVEEAERAIKENPESVIEELLDMLESQMED